MSRVCDRTTGQITEDQQFGGGALQFLYHNPCGRVLLRLAVSPFVSKIYGAYNRSSFSKKKIPPFVERYGINLSDYETEDYACFSDFFIRKRKEQTVDLDPAALISPANAKLTVTRITKDLRIPAKHSIYTPETLTGGCFDLRGFEKGWCLVFRLSVDDDHRYCYMDEGEVLGVRDLPGKLHTVSPLSDGVPVFSQNARVCSLIRTDHGDMLVVEIGAMLVGRIVNHSKATFSRGEEKGYFEPGGSTIIVLTGSQVDVDEDIVENSRRQIETKVRYGERIGTYLC